MNRRGFLRMLGTGAAVGAVAAVAPILPSEVFPFRKIFLPSFVRGRTAIGAEHMADAARYSFAGLSRAPYPGPLREVTLEGVELESFAKSLPDLLFKDSTLYKLLKERDNRQIEWFMNPAQAKAMKSLAKWSSCEPHYQLHMDGGSKFHYSACYAREPDVTTVENELDEITGMANALLKGA